jgi:hypothetical protein
VGQVSNLPVLQVEITNCDLKTEVNAIRKPMSPQHAPKKGRIAFQ